MLRRLSQVLLLTPALLAVAGPVAAEPDQTIITITITGPKPVAATRQAEARAACTSIRTAADLNNIRNNLAGNYCLDRDVNAGSIANFAPIGTFGAPFTGTLDGRGYVIRNLRINSALDYVGLFGAIGDSGSVSNLGLVNARVTGTARAARIGGLAGYLSGFVSPGTVTRTYVTGEVSGTAAVANVGGLVGESYGSIDQSFAHAAVAGRANTVVGGLAGFSGLNSSVTRSYATGPATGGTNARVGGLVGVFLRGSITQSYATGSVRTGNSVDGYAQAGGLVGESAGAIGDSFATGPVRGGDNSWVGGLVGNNGNVGGGVATIRRAYATGPVSASGAQVYAGGLVGYQGTGSGTEIRETYAAGLVQATGDHVGGLTGSSGTFGSITHSYWDTQTSGQATSPGGTGKTTEQLQHALQTGFAMTRWGITPDVSYPYLTRPGLNFASPLATVVPDDKIYTLLPISQLDPSQYATPPAHAEEASLAAVYTIIARAIGITDNVASLKDVLIDEYFWDDATQTATWRGPVRGYASLGPLTAIPAAQPLDLTNVIDPLRHHEPVIIRGRYRKSGGELAAHWMLATSFIVDDGLTVTAVVANDPWTGQQVRIDPSTKTVTSPTDFPLENFKVIGFRVVGGPASAPAGAAESQ